MCTGISYVRWRLQSRDPNGESARLTGSIADRWRSHARRLRCPCRGTPARSRWRNVTGLSQSLQGHHQQSKQPRLPRPSPRLRRRRAELSKRRRLSISILARNHAPQLPSDRWFHSQTLRGRSERQRTRVELGVDPASLPPHQQHVVRKEREASCSDRVGRPNQ